MASSRLYPNIHWLSDDDYAKAVGQLRLQVANILGVFSMYGLGDYIPEATNEIVRRAEDFGLRVRGVDKIIALAPSGNHRG